MPDKSIHDDLATLRHYIDSWAHDGDCMIFLPSGVCTCNSIADKTRPYAALRSLEEQLKAYEGALRWLSVVGNTASIEYVAEFARAALAGGASE